MNYRVLVYNSELSNPYSDMTYIYGIEFTGRDFVWLSLPRLHNNIRESCYSIITWCNTSTSGSTHLCIDPDKDTKDFITIVFYLGKTDRIKVYKWYDSSPENNVPGSRVIYDSDVPVKTTSLCGRSLVEFVDKNRNILVSENPDICSNLEGRLDSVYAIGFNDSLDVVIGRECP